MFANLPTVQALSYDVGNGEVMFLSDELKSLNPSKPVDFLFTSELYMMQEIIKTVCAIHRCFVLCALTLTSERASINEKDLQTVKHLVAVITKCLTSAWPLTCC